MQTLVSVVFLVKGDGRAGTMTFSSSKEAMVNVTTLPVARVKEILALNRQGKKADQLQHAEALRSEVEEPGYRAEEDSITRFDQAKRRKRGGRNRNRGGEKAVQNNMPNENRQEPADKGPEAQKEESARPAREGGNRNDRRGRRNSERQNTEKKPNDRGTEGRRQNAPAEAREKNRSEQETGNREASANGTTPQERSENGSGNRNRRRGRRRNAGGDPTAANGKKGGDNGPAPQNA